MDFDCRQCGACCVAFEDEGAFCDVTEDDMRQLSRGFVRKHITHPPLLRMAASRIYGDEAEYAAITTRWRRMTTGPLKGVDVNACAALRGSLMNRVSCRIYANRPSVCRAAVRPGDAVCRYLRDMVRSALEELPAKE